MPASMNHSHKALAEEVKAPVSTGVRVLMLVAILVAYALRSYHLDFQSLAGDEGISIIRSAQPFIDMLRYMPMEHVPGYFALLHYWMLAAGQSDFSIRTLSLLPGVFTVAFAFRMGVDLGSRRAGLIAAILLATGAFQVWYSQEARMYSWLLLSGMVSTWFLWQLFTRRISAAIDRANRRPPLPTGTPTDDNLDHGLSALA